MLTVFTSAYRKPQSRKPSLLVRLTRLTCTAIARDLPNIDPSEITDNTQSWDVSPISLCSKFA